MKKTNSQETTITRETPINEILEKYPEIMEILMSYGLNCAGCYFSNTDTVGNGAEMHGLPDEDIELMLKDVNEIVGEKK